MHILHALCCKAAPKVRGCPASRRRVKPPVEATPGIHTSAGACSPDHAIALFDGERNHDGKQLIVQLLHLDDVMAKSLGGFGGITCLGGFPVRGPLQQLPGTIKHCRRIVSDAEGPFPELPLIIPKTGRCSQPKHVNESFRTRRLLRAGDAAGSIERAVATDAKAAVTSG